MEVSTLFEEQNDIDIDTLLSEIREIDISPLVSLRTVAIGELSENKIDPGQEQPTDEKEENISLNIDLRSSPIVEFLTVF